MAGLSCTTARCCRVKDKPDSSKKEIKLLDPMYGHIVASEEGLQFHYLASDRKNKEGITEIKIDTLCEKLDLGVPKKPHKPNSTDGTRNTGPKEQARTVSEPGTQNLVRTPKLIVSIFGSYTKDYTFHYNQPVLAAMLQELVDMMVNTGSWLMVHDETKKGDISSMIGNAVADYQGMPDTCPATVVAVVQPWPTTFTEELKNLKWEYCQVKGCIVTDFSKKEKEKKNSGAKDTEKKEKNPNPKNTKEKKSSGAKDTEKKEKNPNPKNTKEKKNSSAKDTEKKEKNPSPKDIGIVNTNIHNYIFWKGIVEVTKEQKPEETGLPYQCTVIVNGDLKELKSVMENSLKRNRPVILIEGLGEDETEMDKLVKLIKKMREKLKRDEKQYGNSNSRYLDTPSRYLDPSRDSPEHKMLDELVGNRRQYWELLHVYDLTNLEGSFTTEILSVLIAHHCKETMENDSKNKITERNRDRSNIDENGTRGDHSDRGDKNGKGDQSDRRDQNGKGGQSDRSSREDQSMEDEKKAKRKKVLTTMLGMCIECDQLKLARSTGLLTQDCSSLESELVQKAIKLERGKFVKYFLDHGLNFGEKITQEDMGVLLGKHRSSTAKEPTDEEPLKYEVRNLIGDFYHLIQQNYNEKELLKKAQGEENLTHRDILIWAVLTNKFDLAKIMLDFVNQRTAAALLACGLTRAEAKRHGKHWSQYESCMEQSREFGTMAEENIMSYFKKNKTHAFFILRREMPAWGNISCIHLAINTGNQHFLSLEPCRIMLDEVWAWGEEADNQMLIRKNQDTEKVNKSLLSSMFPPRVMYSFNLLSLLFFLMAFALLIVSRLKREGFHFLEWIMLVTVFTFVIQEIDQLHRKYKDLTSHTDASTTDSNFVIKNIYKSFAAYLTDYFNAIDFTSLMLFLVAFTVRVLAHYMPQNPHLMETARVLLSVDFCFFTFRILRFCYINESLGPMVFMVIKMLRILLKFLAILMVFFIAYAVASEAVLYPESKMSWALVFHVLRKPYWSMYGELFLDELEADGSDPCTQCTLDPNLYDDYEELRCASEMGRYVVPVLLGIYVLIVNILLFNLLIAQFSSAVQKVEVTSRQVYSYQRAVMLREFSRFILPFPFTPISLFLIYIRPRQEKDMFYYYSPRDNLALTGRSHSEKDSSEYVDDAIIQRLNRLERQTQLEREEQQRQSQSDHRHCCVCGEKKLDDIEDRLMRIEALLKKQRTPSPEPQQRAQSWNHPLPRPPFMLENNHDAAQSHFYVVKRPQH